MDYYPRTYIDTFLDNETADTYFNHFQNFLNWKQYTLSLFGKTLLQPRLICFYADAGIQYSYSNTHLFGNGWEEQLWTLKQSVEVQTGYTFNSVLCNLYRNGNDSMGWHSDDEKELGPDPVIASLSFGAKRVFYLKHKKTQEKQKILLDHGSLLLMNQGTQTNRKHAIMKTKKQIGPRINMTFRNIIG